MFRLSQIDSADKIPRMSESLHDRVRQRLETLELSAQAASLKAGLSKDVLRKLLANPNQLPQGSTLTKLASALETTEQWLLHGGAESATADRSSQPELTVADVPFPYRDDMPKDVPVLGTAAASHGRGAFQLDTHDIIDWVRRPPALAGAKSVYSIYIEGDSMEPKYGPGDLCFVNPHRPPRPGDIVVVQIQYGADEPLEATIGFYRKKSSASVTIGKLNPVGEIEVPADNILAVHRILQTNELFGI